MNIMDQIAVHITEEMVKKYSKMVWTPTNHKVLNQMTSTAGSQINTLKNKISTEYNFQEIYNI